MLTKISGVTVDSELRTRKLKEEACPDSAVATVTSLWQSEILFCSLHDYAQETYLKFKVISWMSILKFSIY